jgi:glycyl-tRNA synthetase alpha chain
MNKTLSYQELIFELQRYWSAQGCVLQQPYDVEVGAGTMCSETFLRVLGPDPYRVAYVQPSRRPNDGRYGENPNRLYKHMQLQVVLKPAPANVQDLYLASLERVGIDLKKHDIKFEEDNWEAPTLGAWGIGWQVMLDGLEISQFTYFQQCGGIDLDPVPVELTYGLERLCAFMQDVDSVYDIKWNPEVRGAKQFTYRDIRFEDERQFSIYNFDVADVAMLWAEFELHEREVKRLTALDSPPLLAAHDQVLKCSHLFNLLDARGAISVTERVGMIARIRDLAVGVAQKWVAPKEEAVA